MATSGDEIILAAAPAEPTLNLSPGSDSGATEDGITNDATPTLNGIADAGATVTIYDGGAQVGQTTAAGDGTWSYTLSPLVQGAHSLTAVATVSGADSPASEALDLTIDTQAPAVALSYTRLSGEDYRVTFTFSEAPVDFSAADVTASGGWVTGVQLSNFTATGDARVYTIDARALPGPGSPTATVVVNNGAYTDQAGNLGASGQVVMNLALVEDDAPQPTVINGVSVGRTVQQTGSGEEETFYLPMYTKNQSNIPDDRFTLGLGSTGSIGVPVGMGGVFSSLTEAVNAQQALNFLATQVADAAMSIATAGPILNALSGTFLGVPQSFGAMSIQLGMGPLQPPALPLVVQGSPLQPSVLFLDATGVLPNTQVVLQSVNYVVVAGQVTLGGGAGPQTVFADGKPQQIVLGEDDDELHGGGGSDTVGSAAGNDRLYGDEGDDRVFGGEGDDFLHGNAGADTVSGDAGGDILQGGKGDDRLDGGAGDDRLLGDLGDDTLTGGAGADVFVGLAGGGRDLVTDFSAAEGDRIHLAGGQAYAAHQAGADTVIELAGGGQLVLANVQLSALPAGWIV